MLGVCVLGVFLRLEFFQCITVPRAHSKRVFGGSLPFRPLFSGEWSSSEQTTASQTSEQRSAHTQGGALRCRLPSVLCTPFSIALQNTAFEDAENRHGCHGVRGPGIARERLQGLAWALLPPTTRTQPQEPRVSMSLCFPGRFRVIHVEAFRHWVNSSSATVNGAGLDVAFFYIVGNALLLSAALPSCTLLLHSGG